ncbi:MAG TPA: response regulator [Ferruginibacter sp.]|nr:response regulator [Ferruginibacter sp.]
MKHILIIDDDRDELSIFEGAFEALTFKTKCTYAEGCEHALNILDYLVPDIIFLDINMPRIDGLECLRRIRRRSHLFDVPVIMFSSGMNKATSQKAIQLGAMNCYQKSNSIQVLSRTIAEILQKN